MELNEVTITSAIIDRFHEKLKDSLDADVAEMFAHQRLELRVADEARRAEAEVDEAQQAAARRLQGRLAPASGGARIGDGAHHAGIHVAYEYKVARIGDQTAF